MGIVFDVERYRALDSRALVVRSVDTPTLVLGSTQDASVVNAAAVKIAPVHVVRRRAGGGAVYLSPAAQLWIDLWLPSGDPLLVADVGESAKAVGAIWRRALGEWGVANIVLQESKSAAPPGLEVVCFAGAGPGELLIDGKKIVGISQWRAREGTLFHSCAYLHWDPKPLGELLRLENQAREQLDSLGAIGLDALGFTSARIDDLTAALASLAGVAAKFE